MTIYVVKEGDTLYEIAQQYEVSPDLLIAENGITNPNQLAIGQTIIISGEESGRREASIEGYVYSYVNRDILRRTLPNLTYLAIFSYGFTERGELLGIDDEELIAAARAERCVPLLVLTPMNEEGGFSNELASGVFANEQARDQLIQNIIHTSQEKGYGGVDVDFEYILPEDKDAFIAFVEDLAEQMRAIGLVTFVALAPKISADQAGLLYEAHDYARLGAAADFVLVMTYEWGYTYSEPRAVAPINEVRRVLDYAVTEIPREKIFMGIPNYGYDWQFPYERGITKAKVIGNEEAIELAVRYGAVIQYDKIAQTPYFWYQNDEGIEHEVWFEDARSIEEKLNLLIEYELQGAGYWNLMRFFQQNWTLVQDMFLVKKELE